MILCAGSSELNDLSLLNELSLLGDVLSSLDDTSSSSSHSTSSPLSESKKTFALCYPDNRTPVIGVMPQYPTILVRKARRPDGESRILML